MTKFVYIAFSADGSRKTGTVESGTYSEAMRQLQANKLKVLELTPDRGASSRKNKFAFLRFPASVNMQGFFADIAMLMQAGLGLDRALKAIAAEQGNDANGKLAEQIVERLSDGEAPSTAFAAVPKLDAEVSALIASGEQSGKLAYIFLMIAEDMKAQKIRRKQAIEAIIYPAFLLFMMMASLLIIMFFLVPAIMPIFESAGKPAPTMIRILEGGRSFLANHAAVMLLAILIFIVMGRRLVKEERVKSTLSSFSLSLPVVGSLIGKRGMVRYFRTLSLLISNGVEMQKALAFATAACTTRAYTDKLNIVREQVVSGQRLSEALKKTGIIPPSIVSLTAIGDEINNLPTVLSRSAQLLEDEAAKIQDRLLGMMTPVITIIMGIMIGGLVISVMSALLSINQLGIQ